MLQLQASQEGSETLFSVRPTPDISWVKEDGELPSSRLTFVNLKKTLKISDVTEDDGGDYRCTASNSLGTAHHVIKVTVKGMTAIHWCSFI